MPAVLKQRNIRILVVRMALYFVQVQIGSDTWPLRQLEITVYNARKFGEEMPLPRFVEVFEGLLKPGVWCRYVNVQTGKSANRSLRGVGYDRAVMGIDHIRHLP